MNPRLVEPSIKHILNHQLTTMKEMNQNKKNILFNLALFILLATTIGITLKLKYKGKQDIVSQKKKENEKRNYILSNLQKYQNRMK